MDTPNQDQRKEAKAHGGDADYNARAQESWPCLTTIEHAAPPITLTAPKRLTVAAWNIERCKRVEDSADLLRRIGADVVLATEVDWGMARSGQRHTTRDLATALGFGYVFGTEFVELGTGDPVETEAFGDVPNANGLHGNALLSRYPLLRPVLIPLDSGGLWFVGQPKNDGQHRVGGRMALAAQIHTADGPITVVVAHYESESTPQSRVAQTEALLRLVDEVFGPGPTVIGGDLNTAEMLDGSRTGAQALSEPSRTEPCFRTFAKAGYSWRGSNAGQPTTRAAPGKPVRYPLNILDWILTRGLAPSTPRVWPAISTAGHYLSDHELLTVDVERTAD